MPTVARMTAQHDSVSWVTSWSSDAPWGASSQCAAAESTIPISPKASGWATAGSISAPSDPSTSMPATCSATVARTLVVADSPPVPNEVRLR